MPWQLKELIFRTQVSGWSIPIKSIIVRCTGLTLGVHFGYNLVEFKYIRAQKSTANK